MNAKVLLILSAGIVLSVCSQGQKRSIDTSTFGKWEKLSGSGISPMGNYVWYQVSGDNYSTLIVQSVDATWKKEVPNGNKPSFSSDNQFFVFKSEEDLCVMHLGTDEKKIIAGVASYKLFQVNGQPMLCYYLSKTRELVLNELSSGKEQKIQQVTNYQFSPDQSTILYTSPSVANSEYDLHIYSPDLNTDQIILSGGGKPSDYTFDKAGRLAFTTGDSIWYYEQGMQKAILKVNNNILQSSKSGKNLTITSGLQFSGDGDWLFFKVKKKQSPAAAVNNSLASVDVWNYKDVPLQSQQLQGTPEVSYWTAVPATGELIEPGSGIVRVEDEWHALLRDDPADSYGSHVLVTETKAMNIGGGNRFDTDGLWWDSASMPLLHVFSLANKKNLPLTWITNPVNGAYYFFLSPDGKYIVYFDNMGKKATKQWYCYGISANKRRCLTMTTSISFGMDSIDGDLPNASYIHDDLPYSSYDPCAEEVDWIAGGKGVLLHDRYDIWQADLATGQISCLTEGIGRKNKTPFHLAASSPALHPGDTILLQSFNAETKVSWHTRKIIGKPGVKLLFKELPSSQNLNAKAAGADAWLLAGETASEAPNLYWTKDGKNLTRMTNIEPQKKFNWLTAELVHWKTFDGRPGLGILYKPENFDSTKKYPIILNYYEQRSEEFNEFKYPDYSNGTDINIPFYVSNGYLVFIPDIHYKLGEVGKSACNYIVSAAEMLSKRKYVDPKRMGLQGHSFGGYQTEFVVTHSNLFAAAMSSAGWPDLISRYGAIMSNGKGSSGQSTTESKRSRIGATLWENRDAYINNSPIFFADKVNTPLLMMNNKEDGQVPFAGGMEMFLALRRLGKKAWLLQYDGEDHSLSNQVDAVDYSMRMKQFFDHYLKGVPAPRWMTEGVPANLKKIESGYEPDPEGSCGKDCPICKKLHGQASVTSGTK